MSSSSSVSSSSFGYTMRHSSSAPQTDQQLEFTPVLKLNMLKTNPGAVKK